jgi:hypothetical protein
VEVKSGSEVRKVEDGSREKNKTDGKWLISPEYLPGFTKGRCPQ